MNAKHVLYVLLVVACINYWLMLYRNCQQFNALLKLSTVDPAIACMTPDEEVLCYWFSLCHDLNSNGCNCHTALLRYPRSILIHIRNFRGKA